MDFLSRLARVMVKPRSTLRAILDQPRDRMALPLFALAVASGILGDLDAPMIQRILQQPKGWQFGLMLAAATVGIGIALVVLAWFYAWVPVWIGRFLEGTGEIREVRSALAWGSAPAIWALLYRLPAAIWLGGTRGSEVHVGGDTIRIDAGALSNACGVALVFALLELLVFVWCLVLLSNTVAEAHRLSPWKGLGTLILSALVPVVVVVAAVLSI
jgi:hypothetical protein